MRRYSALVGGGFRQVSGTNVMPDFCRTGAVFACTGGTVVSFLHVGQGICRPECASSHSKCWPQCEQLNLSWLIRMSLQQTDYR
jgi:hypothetical protein